VLESSKSVARRLHTPGFATHYFVSNGLNVGSGNDSLGQMLAFADRNGNMHTFRYDILGRQTVDAITTLGSGRMALLAASKPSMILRVIRIS